MTQKLSDYCVAYHKMAVHVTPFNFTISDVMSVNNKQYYADLECQMKTFFRAGQLGSYCSNARMFQTTEIKEG